MRNSPLKGIGLGDDFQVDVFEGAEGAYKVFDLLPRRELTPEDLEHIRKKADELFDGWEKEAR